MVHLTVCFYHVTHTFQSEFTIYGCLNVKELLAWNRRKIWSLSYWSWTWNHKHLVCKWTLNHLANWPNNWSVLWVLICTLHLTVCSYHVMYAFQSESTLYGCLNVKELLAWKRHEIWSLSDCSWTPTHNHLVRKRILNHLAKLANIKHRINSLRRKIDQLEIVIKCENKGHQNIIKLLESLSDHYYTVLL